MGKKKDPFSQLTERLTEAITKSTETVVNTVQKEAKKQTSGGTGTTQQKKEEKPATKQSSEITPTAITYQERQRVREIQEDPRRVQAVTPTAITAQEKRQLREYNYTRPIDVSTLLPKQSEDARRRENYARLHPEVLGTKETQETRAANTMRINAATIKRGLEDEIKRLEEARAWAQEIGMFDAHAEDYDSAVVRNFKRDYGSVELLDKKIANTQQLLFQTQCAEMSMMPDFAEKSQPKQELLEHSTHAYGQTWYGDDLYAFVNGADGASVGHGVYEYGDIPDGIVPYYNYIHATQGSAAAATFLEEAVGKKYSVAASAIAGILDGSGVGGVVDIISGREGAKVSDKTRAEIRQQHPLAYNVGNIAGSVGEFTGAKKLFGKVPGIRSMGSATQDIVTTGLATGSGTALQELSPLARGDIGFGEYGFSILGSTAGGATGSAAARGVTALGTKALFKTGFQNNIFANAVNQGVGGAAFTVTNVGTRAIIDPNYNPSGEELARDAAVSFAFQTIGSALRLGAQTKQAKAALDNEAAALKQDFYRMAEAKKAGVVTDTDLVDAMRARSARLRNTLNSTQYIGHGKEVKEALAFLDQLDDFITQAGSMVNARMLPGMAGSSISPGGNLAVPQRGLPTPGLVNSVLPAPGAAVGGQSSVSKNEDPQDVSLLLKRELEGLQSSGEEDTIKKTPPVQLDDQETHAVLGYKSSESYPLNAAIRDGIPLTPTQQQMMDGLDRALPRLPVYQGRVYRRIGFDMAGREALKAFLDEHKPGADIQYPAFTSTSSDLDGYPVEGDLTVTLVIESQGGRDLDGHGNNMEREVVFPRGSAFHIDRVETDEAGKPVIYMREVTNDGAGQLHSEEQHGGVQPMQEVPRKVYLREVPRVDTQAETGGAVPRLRGEGTPGVGIDAQDAPLLIKRELRKIAQAEEAAKAMPLLKRYMLALPEDGGLQQREMDAKVSDAMQRVLAERGRAEEESKPLRERLAQVQAEGKAAMAQIEDRYGRAVAEREAEQGKAKSKLELTKDTTDDTLQKRQGGRKFQSEKIFVKHYGKHSEEFGEISVEEYLRRANILADSLLSDDVVELTRSDGSVARYRFSTNEFVAINADGTIRTFFKPKDGKEYWQNELERN